MNHACVTLTPAPPPKKRRVTRLLKSGKMLWKKYKLDQIDISENMNCMSFFAHLLAKVTSLNREPGTGSSSQGLKWRDVEKNIHFRSRSTSLKHGNLVVA